MHPKTEGTYYYYIALLKPKKQNNRDFNEAEGSYFPKCEQAGRSGTEQHCSFTSALAPGLLVHRVKGDSHPLYDCVSANKKEEKSEDTSPGFKGVTSEL